MPEEVKLTPEERERIEAQRREWGPHHPYLRGQRDLFFTKEDARKERKRIEQAAAAWRKLDERTKVYLRWVTADSMLDTLAQGSDTGLAAAVRSLSEEQRARTLAELADGAHYEFEDGRLELTDDFVRHSTDEAADRPLDPATMLDHARKALLLPSGAAEELPNLSKIAGELYVAWKRTVNWLPGEARLPKAAIDAVASEIANLYGLSPAEATRRTRTALLELDRRNELPLG